MELETTRPIGNKIHGHLDDLFVVLPITKLRKVPIILKITRKVLMPLFFSEHKLVDFDNWFATFENNEVRLEIEKKTGVKAVRLIRYIDEPNHLMVVFDARDPANMSKLQSDPRLQKRFSDKSIFVEPPKIIGGYDVTDVENYVPSSETSMKVFWIIHDLADYNSWSDHRIETDSKRKSFLKEHGVSNIRELQNIEDIDNIISVVIAPSRDILIALLSEPWPQEIFANRDIYKGIPKVLGPFSAIDL